MKLLFWVKSLVALIYVTFGIWLIFNPTKFAGIQLEPMMGRILGAALFLYGLFRVYNHYIEYNNAKGEE